MKISPDFSNKNQGSFWVFDSISVLEMTNVSVGFGWSQAMLQYLVFSCQHWFCVCSSHICSIRDVGRRHGDLTLPLLHLPSWIVKWGLAVKTVAQLVQN